MSFTGSIEQAKPSQSGKSLRILVGGTWYSTDNWALQNAVGRNVTFEVGTSTYNGKTIHFANDAVLTDGVSAQPQQPPPQSENPAPPQAQTPHVAPPPAKTAPDPMAYMAFISNTVAHAISAGYIQDPASITKWVDHAYRAAVAATTGQPNDDIPF